MNVALGKQHDDSQASAGRSLLYRHAGMGLELAAAIIGLTLAGLWVDYRFGTRPTGVLVGAGLGVVGGLYNFIRAALRLGAQAKPTNRSAGPTEGEDRDNTP